MSGRPRASKLRAATNDTEVRARSRAWRLATATSGVVGAGLSAALGAGDTPAAVAGIAAAVGVVAGPVLLTTAAFVWALASSWHHRPVSSLRAATADVDVQLDRAPPRGTPYHWPDEMEDEADSMGAILTRPFNESWNHARVTVCVANDGPYAVRDVAVLALRFDGASPTPLRAAVAEPVDLRPSEQATFLVFEAYECTYEIGTSGGVAHAEAITRRSGVRPSEIAALQVTVDGCPPVELTLPPDATEAEAVFHYLDRAAVETSEPSGS